MKEEEKEEKRGREINDWRKREEVNGLPDMEGGKAKERASHLDSRSPGSSSTRDWH